MPRFAANLSLLFTEYPLAERFDAARRAGFAAAELLFVGQSRVEDLAAAIAGAGLPLLQINTPAGDWDAGERGFAAVPGEEGRFREGARQTIAQARALPAPRVHVMAGRASGAEARKTYLRNLRWLAETAPDLALCIEPINPVDMPGYFLDDFALAAEVIAELGAPNLGLQFDAYHAHRITGDVLASWERWRDLVVHVQVAAAEGRHEPGPGAIDYPAFFDRLDRDGYGGFVCGEYIPRGRTEAGLGWLRQGALGASRKAGHSLG